MDSGKHTWNVDQETLTLMKGAETGDRFVSPTFNIAGLTWKFEAYPNGNADDRAGTFDLFLKLVTMPESWKRMLCFRKVQCDQTKGSYPYYIRYKNGSSYGWLKTMMFPEIQSLNKLSFTVEIIISRIVLKDEDTIFYQKPIDMKPQQICWKMDNDQWKCVQNSHNGKHFASQIFGGIWCVAMIRESTFFRINLILCSMPKDVQSVKAMWNIECILRGKGINKKITNSGTNSWRIHDSGSVLGNYMISANNELPLELIKQCDSIELKVEITPDPDRVATEHWSRLTNPTNTDQKENEIEVEMDPENVISGQRNKRFDLMESRIDSLVSSIDQMGQQMAKMKEDIVALKEAKQNHGGDEEVKEETEEEKLRKWMENEVKLPRYFDVLKENGFEDLQSVLDLTLDEMKEMGIDKMGHRKKIMRHIAELQSANNAIVPVRVSVPQQQVPAAAYSFDAAPAQNPKVDVEGANVVDTGH